MKIKITACCLLFVTIFLSCKKEDLSIGLNPGKTDIALLNEVLIDNLCASEYSYTDSKLISEEKSKFDYTQYTYNKSGQLIKSEFYGNDDVLSTDDQVFTSALNCTEWVTPLTGKLGGTITYAYDDNGQLIKTTTTRTTDPTSEYSDFTYDLKNRISRQTMYWDNSPKGYIDYAYDSKGNLTREMLYNLPESGVAELTTTTNYTFDNQQNPYKSFSGLLMPGINTNMNNIMKETYTIHIAQDQGSDIVLVNENSYEYNASGYPVSKNGDTTYVYD